MKYFEKYAGINPRIIEGAVGGIVGGIGGGILEPDIKGVGVGTATGAVAGLLGSKGLRSLKKYKASTILKGYDIPETYYHGFPEEIENIVKREGLQPGKSHIRGSDIGQKYKNHIFVSKDKDYAKTYGRVDHLGNYHPFKRSTYATIITPKTTKKTNIFKDSDTPYYHGAYIHDGDTKGIGSEYVIEGGVSPEFLAFNKHDTQKLKEKITNINKKRRTDRYGRILDKKVFGMF